jgi:hypothetical protein
MTSVYHLQPKGNERYLRKRWMRGRTPVDLPQPEREEIYLRKRWTQGRTPVYQQRPEGVKMHVYKKRWMRGMTPVYLLRPEYDGTNTFYERKETIRAWKKWNRLVG